MIDWKKYPEISSVEIFYYDENGDEIDSEIVCIPTEQTKTVADAVEWHKSKGWGVIWASEERDCITYGIMGFAFANSNSVSESRYIICTRAEFEAYVKEQEGEKWTHTHLGEKCYVVHIDGCAAWVVVQNAGGKIVTTHGLKPIKPTITKAEAWDLCQDYEGSQGMVKYMLDLHEEYNII